MIKYVSPDDMMNAAKTAMLDGAEPVTDDDWILLVNFFAANMRIEATKLVCNLFDCPIDASNIEFIVKKQTGLKSPVFIYTKGVTCENHQDQTATRTPRPVPPRATDHAPRYVGDRLLAQPKTSPCSRRPDHVGDRPRG